MKESIKDSKERKGRRTTAEYDKIQQKRQEPDPKHNKITQHFDEN